jgi:GTP-binding protein
MEITTAEFLVSNTDFTKCPAEDRPEYAFIGRSNVGKSSLINMLCAKKGMAKTSSTPGKTQLINHFNINNQWYLVDLPGYGFAKVGKEARSKWDIMINDYIMYRKNLLSVFILIDIRLEPQQKDIDFIERMGENAIPFSLVFTKADKLARTKNEKSVKTFTAKMLESWDAMPPVFITSAEEKTGREEVLNYIEETNKLYKK